MPQMYGERRFRITRSHKKKDKYTKKRPPVRKGETLEIQIEDVSRKGDGVGKIDNFAVFVPGTKIGEIVNVKIIEIKKSCAVGKKIG